jgi:hypothetical protein
MLATSNFTGHNLSYAQFSYPVFNNLFVKEIIFFNASFYFIKFFIECKKSLQQNINTQDTFNFNWVLIG